MIVDWLNKISHFHIEGRYISGPLNYSNNEDHPPHISQTH